MFQMRVEENSLDPETMTVRGEKSVPMQNNYNTAGTIAIEQYTFHNRPIWGGLLLW